MAEIKTLKRTSLDGKPIARVVLIDQETGQETPAYLLTCAEGVECPDGRILADHLGVIDEYMENGEEATKILEKLKTVDGTGSGLDADTLDGRQADDFALKANIPDEPDLSGYMKAEDYLGLNPKLSVGKSYIASYAHNLRNGAQDFSASDVMRVSSYGVGVGTSTVARASVSENLKSTDERGTIPASWVITRPSTQTPINTIDVVTSLPSSPKSNVLYLVKE